MFLAVHRLGAALHIEARFGRTGIKLTLSIVGAHHAVVCVLLAVCRRLAACDIETRSLFARVV